MTTEHAFIVIIGMLGGMFFLGFAMGYSLAKDQFRCKHKGGRTTTFYGIDDLRDMMSGKITIEEWKNRPDMKTVSKCMDCGEILP